MNDLPPGALHPVTVITGASAGLGAELAKVFASHGHALVLVARREAELRALADELAALPAQAGRPRALVVAMDLARPDAADQLVATLTGAGVEPAYVVNNAGFGLVGAAAALPRDRQRAMVDLNIGALTDLSLAFLDSLRRHRGGILNVASLAGFLPGPGMAVYYATKAYVVSLSEALHKELAPEGIRVTALCPGPVPTEFQKRAGVAAESYPPFVTRSAAATAAMGYEGLMQGRRIVVPGLAGRLVLALPRLLPRGWLLSLSGKRELRRVRARQG